MNREAWAPMKWTQPGTGAGSIAHLIRNSGLSILTRRAPSSEGACLSCRRVVGFLPFAADGVLEDGHYRDYSLAYHAPERAYHVFG